MLYFDISSIVPVRIRRLSVEQFGFSRPSQHSAEDRVMCFHVDQASGPPVAWPVRLKGMETGPIQVQLERTPRPYRGLSTLPRYTWFRMRMRKRLLILGNGLVAGSMDCWDSRLPFFWGRNGPPGMETKPEPRGSREIK